MNSQSSSQRLTSHYSPRAAFSPLMARATQRALTRLGVATRGGRGVPSTHARAISSLDAVPAVALRARWHPTLIDRLQTPLTRYHD